MIIDCDTHLMPRDAFEGIPGRFDATKPALHFSDEGLYVSVDFPGNAADVPGISPLPGPGSGAMLEAFGASRSPGSERRRKKWKKTPMKLSASYARCG